VILRAPAKVNLFLEVLGKRPDGYHEIATVMAPITLADTLSMERARRDQLVVTPKGAAPVDGSNTVRKVIAALRKRAPFPPVRVRLRKHIPSGAGLGGGSSDAAGAVRLANRMFKLGLTIAQEAELLAEVGSDTSFFAHGRWALCTGRGEIVKPIRGKRLRLVLVCPPFECPTAEIYGRYRHRGPRRKRTDALFNRLEEPAFAFRPELAAIKREMQSMGFEGVLMSGSGSSIYGVCANATAQRVLHLECARRWGFDRVHRVETLQGIGRNK
jgi:4-diphosphocytidyl-2-C-methyl-D-erythritol kinase